jgi:dipeptidyl aminopeptidase/acylaminoacyl peptidase
MKTEKVCFESEGSKIAGVLHLPGENSPPCVIASHGLLSSKESGKYVVLGERLSNEGIALLRFDFRGCGESEGSIEDDSITRRIADLGSAIRFLEAYPGLGNRFGLLGSSLGGYVSLLRASMEKGVRALVLWATPFHLDDLERKRDEEEYALPGEAFFRDMAKHRLGPLLPKVSNCLVIHGEADELVPVDQAWEIFHQLGGGKEIHILEHADHRLSDPSHRQRAIDLSIQWFKKFL